MFQVGSHFNFDPFRPNYTEFPLAALASQWHAVQKPGELIFIPARCPHAVRTVIHSMNFSLSYHYEQLTINAQMIDIYIYRFVIWMIYTRFRWITWMYRTSGISCGNRCPTKITETLKYLLTPTFHTVYRATRRRRHWASSKAWRGSTRKSSNNSTSWEGVKDILRGATRHHERGIKAYWEGVKDILR